MREETAYRKSVLNSRLFSGKRVALRDLSESTRRFFTREHLRDGDAFLDVGGAGGIMADAIKREIADIRPTIVDPDPRSVKIGRAQFPDFEFVQGYYPRLGPRHKNRKFDAVSMQTLFPLIPDWKTMLLALRRSARRWLNLSLMFKLHGTTVVDKDVSYCYYYDSGERVHQIVHNIYEFMNFCCIREMGARKIEFFGYHTPYSGHNFRCVPNEEQIKGNVLLHFFEDEKDNQKRFGGAVEEAASLPGYRFFVPEMDLVIDGRPFDLRRGSKA